jgi:CDP-diacylglycerol--serine O-phosphatidyltransferase
MQPKGCVTLRPELKHMRGVLPNALTMGNLFCGLAVCWWAASEFDPGWAPLEVARRVGVEGWFGVGGQAGGGGALGSSRAAGLRVLVSVWFVGQLFDLLDGAVARALKVTGQTGAMLDSLADFVAAGVAPAFIGVALWKEVMPAEAQGAWMLMPIGVAVAAAWRLARFHAEGQGESGSQGFVGMPAPAAVLWWGSVVWALSETLGLGGVDGSRWLLGGVLAGTVAVPLLMVSRMPFLSFKHWGENRPLDWIRGGFLATALVLLVMSEILTGSPVWGALVALTLYPIWSWSSRQHLRN